MSVRLKERSDNRYEFHTDVQVDLEMNLLR